MKSLDDKSNVFNIYMNELEKKENEDDNIRRESLK